MRRVVLKREIIDSKGERENRHSRRAQFIQGASEIGSEKHEFDEGDTRECPKSCYAVDSIGLEKGVREGGASGRPCRSHIIWQGSHNGRAAARPLPPQILRTHHRNSLNRRAATAFVCSSTDLAVAFRSRWRLAATKLQITRNVSPLHSRHFTDARSARQSWLPAASITAQTPPSSTRANPP